jgi:hypothetical protein
MNFLILILLTAKDNWDFYFYDGTTISGLLTTEQFNFNLPTTTNHWALCSYYGDMEKSSLPRQIEAELINISYRVISSVPKQT